MFKSKILWAFILGVATSVFFVEGRINLGYSHVWTRIINILTAAGTHLVAAINTPGSLIAERPRFLSAIGFACNFLIYLLFWYVLIAIASYVFSRRHPYDHENTLVPPVTR